MIIDNNKGVIHSIIIVLGCIIACIWISFGGGKTNENDKCKQSWRIALLIITVMVITGMIILKIW